ncbi:hypothetical protein QA640_34195 [Bradyrhizobium sp. CB82]|uniref:hypothetical protein n=1 Tax=Bradyrhizobium sp. CB82 TaxID=3039159 RepID=UPI0024B0B91C|nr:hypothetical protein [Bradyrhizobium sp. CB82]WFU39375.1 hypothetical protein QA640_34195 [Bradyrhizobium sp. CB82]
MMVGLVIIFVLLAIGFAAGYGTRGLVSRKRHAEYLKFQPYISQSPDDITRARHAASEPPMPERQRSNHDITRSFQDIFIHQSKPAKPARPAAANLHLVQTHHRPQPEAGSLQPATIEQSLQELVALLQGRRQEG